VPCGTRIAAGDALMRVHARSRAQAQAATLRLGRALRIDDAAPAVSPVVIEPVNVRGAARSRMG
jgi:thymidine phosphorylase